MAGGLIKTRYFSITFMSILAKSIQNNSKVSGRAAVNTNLKQKKTQEEDKLCE